MNWQDTTIGSICDEHGGDVQTGPFGSQLHASDYAEHGIPIVMPQDMQNGSIVCERIARLAPQFLDRHQRHMLEVNDIVFSRRGDVTRFAVVTETESGWICGTGSIRIRLKCPTLDARYMSAYLRQPQIGSWLINHAQGVTMPNLNTGILRALPVRLPPLSEQRRIADVLDRAEALRANRRAALAELDGLDDAIFVDLFGDTSSNPKLWETVQIRDIGDIQGGLQVTTARALLPLEIPYLRVANVYRDRVDLSEVKFIRATELEVARTSLAFHDLLIVEGHGNPLEIGRCGLWKREISPCVHQNHLIRVRVDNTRVDPVFAWRYLNTIGGRRDLLRAAKTTSGLNTISVSNVKDASLWLPPLALQQEFARRVAVVEKLKAVQRASLAELDALFASLQDRAFRGAL